MSMSDSKWYGRLCVNCGHDYAVHSEHLSGKCFGTQEQTGSYKHDCEMDCPKFNHKGFEYLVKIAMKVGKKNE